MSDGDPPCAFAVDCAGLYEIATTKSNSVKSACIDGLSKGLIAVPICVWKEFEGLYETEAAALGPNVKNKLRLKNKHRVGAATIADSMNPGFSTSPYDASTDYYAASICWSEGLTLLTAGSQTQVYEKMACCTVVAVSDWSVNFGRTGKK